MKSEVIDQCLKTLFKNASLDKDVSVRVYEKDGMINFVLNKHKEKQTYKVSKRSI